MRLIDRIRNVWKLSELETGQPTDEYKIPGSEIVTLVKKPAIIEKARFIPFIKGDPVKDLVAEQS